MKKQYYYVLSTHARQIKWYATYCRTHLGIRFKYVCTKFRKKEAEKDVLWCRWTFKLRSFYNRNSTGSFWGILRTWHFLRKWIMYSFAKADVNLKIYIEKIFSCSSCPVWAPQQALSSPPKRARNQRRPGTQKSPIFWQRLAMLWAWAMSGGSLSWPKKMVVGLS